MNIIAFTIILYMNIKCFCILHGSQGVAGER